MSSNLSTILPWYLSAYRELIATPLECPMDKGPLGLGANLRITSDVFPGRSLKPSFFLCLSLSRASGAKLSNSLRTPSIPSSRAMELALVTSFSTNDSRLFTRVLSCSLSARTLPRTLPDCPLPLYSIAFCNAYLRTASRSSRPKTSSSVIFYI